VEEQGCGGKVFHEKRGKKGGLNKQGGGRRKAIPGRCRRDKIYLLLWGGRDEKKFGSRRNFTSGQKGKR